MKIHHYMGKCFFNDTVTTESYTGWHTRSLHDALPILTPMSRSIRSCRSGRWCRMARPVMPGDGRSEEHTSELQSLMRISYAVFCLKKRTILKSSQYYTSSMHKFYNTHEQ